MAFKRPGKFVKKKDAKKKLPPKKTNCRFCRRAGVRRAEGAAAVAAAVAAGGDVTGLPKVNRVVDYKDLRTLQKLCTSQGKLFSRKRSGNCAKHQRQFRRAAKRARFLALLPYVVR